MKPLLLILALAVAIPATAGASQPFDDVGEGRFFTEPVAWALENGITTGKTETTFEPGTPVTRAEAVTFLHRYHENVASQLDTDTDTLGNLDCVTGQVALDNGNSWVCGDVSFETSWQSYEQRQLIDNGNQLADWVSITRRSDGLPFIAYSDRTDDSLRAFVCTSNDCAHGTDLLLADDAAYARGFYASAALSADGLPLVAHRGSVSGGMSLRLYACADADCSTGTDHELHVATTIVGTDASLAIGADGIPVIAHTDSINSSLDFYRCNNTDCSDGLGTNITLVDDATDLTGWYPHLEIGSDGNPIIAFTNASLGSVEVYVCGDPACATGTQVQLIDDSTDVYGVYLDFAIGVDGLPIVTFSSSLNDSLWFYRCSTVDCTAGSGEEIIAVGEAMTHPSIEVTSDGDPVIIFGNDDTRRLEIYDCADSACSSGTHTVMWEEAGSTRTHRPSNLLLEEDGRIVLAIAIGTTLNFGTLRYGATNIG